MSKLLNLEEMMLVGGGCSRGLSKAKKNYDKQKNSAGAKMVVKVRKLEHHIKTLTKQCHRNHKNTQC